jgi:hypothetical protein
MKKIIFTIPKDYMPPEGVKAGETFNEAAVFKMEENGKLCLVQIGESELYDDKDKEQKESGEFMNRYNEAMMQPQTMGAPQPTA